MAMRLRIALVGPVALIVLSAVAGRAEPTRPLVSVPLFVTDPKGASISNLKALEIEIAEGGATQKVASIIFRGGSRRRIALFLDEYHVSPGGSTSRARAAVARFVERYVAPDDAVIVMKPLDPRAAAAPLPGKEAVHLAVSAFEGRRGAFQPRGEFEAQYMSTAPEAAERQRAQVVRAGLETLALELRDESGEVAQALVIVTEGFRSNESTRMRTTTLRSIGRAARLANVPVYIVDPSEVAPSPSPLSDAWHAMARETGGVLFSGGGDLDAAFARVATDLQTQYLVEFHAAANDDGRFHDIQVKVNRRGAQVRAPSGYWAPFAAPRASAAAPRNYATLLTPHVSGLIQPWFRMTPAADGKTRVTFAWAPRPGRKITPDRVELSAVTFEGTTLHASEVAPVGARGDLPAETSFLAPPGPLQISMRISASKRLDTDVRYIDVPKLDVAKPFIAAVELVRPRSLPEFNTLATDPTAMPTEVREFHRQDRLLVRVRAFAPGGTPRVDVKLLNRQGEVLMELPALQPVDGVAQFELPFARFTRGDYRLHVRATSAGESAASLIAVRLIG